MWTFAWKHPVAHTNEAIANKRVSHGQRLRKSQHCFLWLAKKCSKPLFLTNHNTYDNIMSLLLKLWRHSSLVWFFCIPITNLCVSILLQIILRVPNLNQKIGKIYSLVHRKQKMVLKSRQVNNSSVFGHSKETKLPCLKANWGLDHDGPNVFTNSIQAINNLVKILNLQTSDFV